MIHFSNKTSRQHKALSRRPFSKSRADDGIWTRDLFLTKEVLYPWATLAIERKTRLKLATLSLEGWCSINWATSAKSCGRRWIRTTEGINQQIYSLPHLATLVFALWPKSRPKSRFYFSSFLSLLSDSNQRPRDYKSRALANWAKEALSFCFALELSSNPQASAKVQRLFESTKFFHLFFQENFHFFINHAHFLDFSIWKKFASL